MGSNPIRPLPPEVASQIAAGEVVERPASVVKELIENSLDAGATAISVEIREGGLRLIRVSDDGHGIPRRDLPLVLERFATSKVRTLQDLEQLTTLGFRGEALSSIAAVARLEIRTRTAEEVEGSLLRAAPEGPPGPGGAPTLRSAVEPAASPVGTSVTVRDLFSNVPARRKFLKSPLRERDLVQATLLRYALAYPHVAFRLVVDGRERFVAPPGDPLARLAIALGREVASRMLPIHWEAGDLRIHGFISDPTMGRSNRRAQFFFLNRRPIRSGLLAVMLERPYAGRLPPGRYPLAVVHIEVDPRLVDVNVHPRKAEVRFAQERAVYQALLQAVGQALEPFPVQEMAVGWPAGGLTWPFEGVAEEAEAPWTVRETGAEYAVGGLRAMGQLQATYIVAQGPEGLVVVDQHAAHEQVLYERIVAGGPPHLLSPPARLTLTTDEADRLMAHLPLFADLGLEVEPFGGNSFLVRSLPAPLADQDPAALVTALLEELDRLRPADGETLRERLAMKAACVAAVKAGDHLTPEQMQALLEALMGAWSPATCPHGRPAFILLTVEELERRFLRR